jgi:hypothetical protein
VAGSHLSLPNPTNPMPSLMPGRMTRAADPGARDFHTGVAALQWVMNGYTLTLARSC